MNLASTRKQSCTIAILSVLTLTIGCRRIHEFFDDGPPNKSERPFTTNDTPIKVRGGAMTFVAKTWIQLQTSICTPTTGVDFSKIAVEGFGDSLPDGLLDSNDLPVGDWTIVLYGGFPDGTGAYPKGQHGVTLTSDSHHLCDGTSTGSSVTIASFGDQLHLPAFYADSNTVPTLPVGHRRYKRFMDNYCQAQGTDEDLCERMTAIAIFAKGASIATPPPAPYPVQCAELDCTVWIGKDPHAH